MVYHLATIVFKPDVTPATIKHCLAELESMVGRIPGLLTVHCGAYQSPEGLNDGFTHGFVMTFDTPANRDAYLPHPEHERVKAIVVPNVERVMVFDFTV